jgi:hypothetical protein
VGWLNFFGLTCPCHVGVSARELVIVMALLALSCKHRQNYHHHHTNIFFYWFCFGGFDVCIYFLVILFMARSILILPHFDAKIPMDKILRAGPGINCQFKHQNVSTSLR